MTVSWDGPVAVVSEVTVRALRVLGYRCKREMVRGRDGGYRPGFVVRRPSRERVDELNDWLSPRRAWDDALRLEFARGRIREEVTRAQLASMTPEQLVAHDARISGRLAEAAALERAS